MKPIILTSVVLCLALSGPAVGATEPPTIEDCIALAEQLADMSQAAGSLNQRDQDGLECKALGIKDKLVDAAEALAAGYFSTAVKKLEDADQKLGQYQGKLATLAATIGTDKQKISAADEAALRGKLDELAACLDAL